MTAMQETVASIWASILGTQPTSSKDNFFDLGGNSLNAMRVVARLKHITGCPLTIGDFVRHQTIEELASRIEEKLAAR